MLMQSKPGEMSWKTHDEARMEEITQEEQEEYQKARRFGRLYFDADGNLIEEKGEVPKPDIDMQLLTRNKYSRPGKKTKGVKYIVIHYLGNPGTTAQENRDYFESLKDLKDVSMSSNYIVGLDGEIIQCVPDDEVAYASNSANKESISIENCNIDHTGKFLKKTYISLVMLTAYLVDEYGLERDQIIRHYDVTGKDCPLYFVEDEEAWETFKDDVMHYLYLCYKNSPHLENISKELKGLKKTYSSKEDKSIVKEEPKKHEEDVHRPYDYEEAYDDEEEYYDDSEEEYYEEEYPYDEYVDEEYPDDGFFDDGEEYYEGDNFDDGGYVEEYPEAPFEGAFEGPFEEPYQEVVFYDDGDIVAE